MRRETEQVEKRDGTGKDHAVGIWVALTVTFPGVALVTAVTYRLLRRRWPDRGLAWLLVVLAAPAVVAVVMVTRYQDHWLGVFGALINNIWSFAGDSDRPDVNQMTLQPFVNYNFKGGWYASFSPIITANWRADPDNRWTVPVGGAVGRVFKIGHQPINAQVGAYYNAIAPDNTGPSWQIRAQIQLLFPK